MKILDDLTDKVKKALSLSVNNRHEKNYRKKIGYVIYDSNMKDTKQWHDFNAVMVYLKTDFNVLTFRLISE